MEESKNAEQPSSGSRRNTQFDILFTGPVEWQIEKLGAVLNGLKRLGHDAEKKLAECIEANAIGDALAQVESLKRHRDTFEVLNDDERTRAVARWAREDSDRRKSEALAQGIIEALRK